MTASNVKFDMVGCSSAADRSGRLHLGRLDLHEG